MYHKLPLYETYKKNDFIVGLFFIIFDILILLEIVLNISNHQSKIFPAIAVVIIGLSGLALIVSAVFKRSKEKQNSLIYKRIELLLIGLLLVYYFAMQMIGFYTTTLLFLVFTFLIVERSWSKRAFKTAVIYSLIITVTIYVSFSIFLRMMMPAGILF